MILVLWSIYGLLWWPIPWSVERNVYSPVESHLSQRLLTVVQIFCLLILLFYWLLKMGIKISMMVEIIFFLLFLTFGKDFLPLHFLLFWPCTHLWFLCLPDYLFMFDNIFCFLTKGTFLYLEIRLCWSLLYLTLKCLIHNLCSHRIYN